MTRCRVLLIFSCLTFLSMRAVTAQPSTLPSYTLHPQGGVLPSGASINLTCSATSPTSTPVSVSWVKDGVLVPSETKSWLETTVTADGSGAGEFICLATNDVGTVGSKTAIVQLAVLETSFTSLDLESANANPVTAQQGQPLSISCGGYTSVPNSPLEWDIYATPLIRLDSVLDRAIVGINGELYFQDPFPDNERVFQCSVQNSVSGVNRNGYVKLIVESTTLTPSTPVILSAPQDMVVKEGGDAFFECIVGGQPLPTITWTYPGTLTAIVRPSQNGATIRVQAVQANDAGTYTCTTAGVNSFSATLSLAAGPTLSTFLPSSLLTVTYGSPISLQCGSSQDGQWQWYHNGLRLEGEVGPTLEVSSSVEEDSGTYQCFISNLADYASSVGLVNVITVPASITNGGLPSKDLAFRDEPFVLMCSADGAPPPSYIWLKESVPLSDGPDFDLSVEGVLRITNVESSSGGNYTCTASNRVGGREVGRDETSTFLSVIAPTVLTNQLGETFQVQVGTTTILTCEVNHDPQATISYSWTKDDQTLTTNERIMYLPGSASGNLRVERVEKSDAGVYACTITTRYNNLIGPIISTITTNLSVQDMPVAPVIISVTALSSTSLNVQWHFPGSSDVLSDYSIEFQESAKSDQGWTGAKTQSASVTTVTDIQQLIPFTEYNVRVVAIYSQGAADPTISEVRSARTLAEIPSDPPQNVQVRALNNTALRFSWQPPTQPNGAISDYRIQYRILRNQNNVDFTTVRVGSGTALTFIVTGLEPLERYEYQLAAVNSAGVGPYSDIQHADTIAPGLMEPDNTPFHQQIWFIVVMVIVAIIVIVTIVTIIILVVKCNVKQKTQRYQVRHSGYFGGNTVSDGGANGELSDDAFMAYSARNKRAVELKMFGSPNSLNMDTDQDSNFIDNHSIAYSSTATPQLSISSSTRLVSAHHQGPAPGYIDPPSFEEAIKRPRSHSVSSMRSNIDKPPSEYWEPDHESKSGLIDEPLSDLEDEVDKRAMSNPHHYDHHPQQVSPRHGVLRPSHAQMQYDYDDTCSDSVGKPSYASSDITEGTEYSHLQAIGEAGYSHLETPDSNVNHATFV